MSYIDSKKEESIILIDFLIEEATIMLESFKDIQKSQRNGLKQIISNLQHQKTEQLKLQDLIALKQELKNKNQNSDHSVIKQLNTKIISCADNIQLLCEQRKNMAKSIADNCQYFHYDVDW